jgi:hypothetical protein
MLPYTNRTVQAPDDHGRYSHQTMKSRKLSRRPIASTSRSAYHPATHATKRGKRERQGMDAELLSPIIKENIGQDDVAVSTVGDAILAIRDILQFAKTGGAEVVVLCRSLHYLLREKLWMEVSGSTFADQLEEAIEGGARVRLLLTKGLSDEVISAKIVSLADQYEPNRFDMFATGSMDFFKTFPHFTLVKRGNIWFDYVEWEHVPGQEPPFIGKSDRVDGKAYLGPKAGFYGNALKRRFDSLFRKSQSAAAKKVPAQFAAASLIS